MKKKGSLRRIPGEVREFIYAAAIAPENKLKAREVLAEEIEKQLGNRSPSFETNKKLISEGRNQPPSELDKTWSVGCCLKYNILGDVIPLLIELRERHKMSMSESSIYNNLPPHLKNLHETVRAEMRKEPTIRQARWFTRLYNPIETLISEKQADASSLRRLGFHFIIAKQYAQRERASEIMGKNCPDTTDLDEHYFINQNLDVVEGEFIDKNPEALSLYRQIKEARKLIKEVKNERSHRSKVKG